jgi:hypothetical protein
MPPQQNLQELPVEPRPNPQYPQVPIAAPLPRAFPIPGSKKVSPPAVITSKIATDKIDMMERTIKDIDELNYKKINRLI